ncbi:HD domain-containing protein [Patescibacteria group bacterium]|nr:HD domain-containing protein [Patescibacteria group bacterium]
MPPILAGIDDPVVLKRLLEIGKLVSSKLEIRDLVYAVIKGTRKLVKSDRTSLWLVDHKRQELYTLVGEELDAELRLPVKGKGLAGLAVRNRQTVNIPDAYAHPDFDPGFDIKTGYMTCSVLCQPITRKGEVVACFQAINRIGMEGDGVSRSFWVPVKSGEIWVRPFDGRDEALTRYISDIVGVAVENSQVVEKLHRQFNSAIKTFADAIDGRDPTTGEHTKMVTAIAVAIAKEMGLPPLVVERVRVAAIVHDYGKITIPDAVLLKPGSLTEVEWIEMKRHPVETRNRLARFEWIAGLEDIPKIAGAHHEQWMGGGYPDGLSGEAIPEEACIIAAADICQALMQERPYKPAKTAQQSVEIIRREMTGKQLKPAVVAALVRVYDKCGGDFAALVKLIDW